jgi:hypothetical protein
VVVLCGTMQVSLSPLHSCSLFTYWCSPLHALVFGCTVAVLVSVRSPCPAGCSVVVTHEHCIFWGCAGLSCTVQQHQKLAMWSHGMTQLRVARSQLYDAPALSTLGSYGMHAVVATLLCGIIQSYTNTHCPLK